MVLGQRFNVLILVPAIAVGAVGIGLAPGEQAWSIVVLAVGATVALQLGYLVGTGVRSLICAGRASRAFPGSAPAVVRRTAH
jgi:hypothetical protein